MDLERLIAIVSAGEDSQHQFKSDIRNETSLGQEMIAFSNSGGGMILIGVRDDGRFSDLDRDDMGRLNQLVSNAASQQVRPPINPKTDITPTQRGLVMRVSVFDGIGKPYMDRNGVIWVKSGADKRRATSREEIQRMFQRSGLIHGDEVPVAGLTVADLDREYFAKFIESNYGKSISEYEVPLPKLLESMSLMRDGLFNVAGALLFTKTPEFRLPVYNVKAMAFPGREIDVAAYDDSQDINGKFEKIYRDTIAFLQRNVRRVQDRRSVNSEGVPQVPRVVFEELVMNALVHRDYFVPTSTIVVVFADRIEITSPGHLPNNLTIDNIKMGRSAIRNPVLASHAFKILPYRGLGTGIVRVLKLYPHIDFRDDVQRNRFVVTIWLDRT